MADKKKSEEQKPAEPTSPPAPATKPEEKEKDSAAVEAVKVISIGGVIVAALLALKKAFESEGGSAVAGKAGSTVMMAGELGLKELTHERGALATTLRENRGKIIAAGAKQRRLKKREDRSRFIQTLLMPLRLFIPVPLWATAKADEEEPETVITPPARRGR